MNKFSKLTVSAIWAMVLFPPDTVAAPPPTRDQAEALMDDLTAALKTERAETVMHRFHRAPKWTTKQFENQVYSLFEMYADDADLSVLEELGRAGSWGTAGDLFDKERLRRRTVLHGVNPGDCHALVSKKIKAEVLFHWNGANLTIFHYSDPATKKALSEYLEEGLDGIRGTDGTGIAMAFFTLSNLGPNAEVAIPTLTKYLEHDDTGMRIRAAITLWNIDRKAEVSVPPLLAVLTDPEIRAGTRAMAAECLGSIGTEARSAAKGLRAAMDEEDARLRANAAWGLWKTSGESESTIPVLLDLLSDRKVSYIAGNAIAKMVTAFRSDPARVEAGNRLIQQVIDASSSEDLGSRRAAIGTLGKIGVAEKPIRAALEKALEDEDIQIRTGASMALKKLESQPQDQ